jgi:hypothetical protein
MRRRYWERGITEEEEAGEKELPDKILLFITKFPRSLSEFVIHFIKFNYITYSLMLILTQIQ